MTPMAESKGMVIAKERSEIWDRLTETHVVDDLAIRRLQRRIDDELSINGVPLRTKAIMCHELAYLYAYQRKIKQAIAFMDDADRYGLPLPAIQLSKAHMYWMNGEILQSRTVLAQVDPNGERQMISTLVGSTSAAGMFETASQMINALSKGDRPEDESVKAAASIIREVGACDADVTARLDHAARIIRKAASHPVMAYDLFALEGEGILFQFVVDGPIDQLADLESSISESLIDQFEDSPIDSIFSIGIKPHVFTGRDSSYGPYRADF